MQPAIAGVVLAVSAPIWLNVFFSSSFGGAAPATAWLTLLVTARAWLTTNTFALLGRGYSHQFSVVEGVSMGLLGLGAVLAARQDDVTVLAAVLGTMMMLVALITELLVRRNLGTYSPLRSCGVGVWSLIFAQVGTVVVVSWVIV